MSELAVRAVESAADLDAFIDLAWVIQGGDPNWVPPIKAEQKKLLSPGHPFWAQAEGRLFLAERDGRAVGRIAAIMDRAHIAYHQELSGAWGFFECADDPEAARALFHAARAWCM